MAFFQYKLTLIVSDDDEPSARIRAENTYDNLCEMIGYAPYSITLELDEGAGEEVEFDDEEADADDATWD